METKYCWSIYAPVSSRKKPATELPPLLLRHPQFFLDFWGFFSGVSWTPDKTVHAQSHVRTILLGNLGMSNSTSHPDMKLQSTHFNSSQQLEVKQNGNTDVIIRSFESRDSHVVRNIFAQSMGEMRGPFVRDVMSQAVLYGLSLSLPVGLLNLVWTPWSLMLYFFILFALLLALFAGLHIGFSRYIQNCLHSDLDNVESIYLSHKGSHMWVAEFNGTIIGMVALVPEQDHEYSFGKPREAVGRLRRMAVLPEFRRLGVAKKLLNELMNYSKEIGYKQIVLLTTSAQEAALKFYPKHGFQLVSKRLANIALRGFYHYVYCYDLERLNKVV